MHENKTKSKKKKKSTESEKTDNGGITLTTSIIDNGLVFLVYKELLEIEETKTSKTTEVGTKNVNICQTGRTPRV